jgi:hypothetical protein
MSSKKTHPDELGASESMHCAHHAAAKATQKMNPGITAPNMRHQTCGTKHAAPSMHLAVNVKEQCQ